MSVCEGLERQIAPRSALARMSTGRHAAADGRQSQWPEGTKPVPVAGNAHRFVIASSSASGGRARSHPATLKYLEDKEGHAMLALFVLPLVLAYGPAAVWALGTGGGRRLWALCVGMLGAVILLALLLSAVYSVPSTRLVVAYMLTCFGPAILLSTGFLALANASTRSRAALMATSMAGVVIGLLAGLGLAIFTLRVW
jgi:hypothetical protein